MRKTKKQRQFIQFIAQHTSHPDDTLGRRISQRPKQPLLTKERSLYIFIVILLAALMNLDYTPNVSKRTVPILSQLRVLL